MKILQLCKKFPFPLKDGESIAINSLSKALFQQGCELTLLAMNTRKHFFDLSLLPESFNHYKKIHAVTVDTRVKPIEAFRNLFSKDSYNIARFVSDEYARTLVRLLQKEDFDVVQLETLYLAPYIPYIRKYSNAQVVMRAHNVEHEIWQRMTQNTAFLPKKWYFKHLTRKLRQYEIDQLNSYDLLLPITDRDLYQFRQLGCRRDAMVTPIGINSADYTPCFDSYRNQLSISFIGSLDWMPNIEGLKWFLDNVWPKVQQKYPNIEFHIAGRNTPEWLLQLKKKNVIVHGEVDSATQFINQHSVMLVPLFSGSGMRAKILEGMALGKTVITTRIGLEGIQARHKEEVLMADTVDEFMHAIRYANAKKIRLQRIGRNARDYVLKYYDSQEIARFMIDAFVQEALEVA